VSYSLFLLPRAVRQMESLNNAVHDRVLKATLALKENPRPANSRKLTNREGWRLRVGTYRILYEINDETKSVTILDVGHRKEIYR
jgi:mRNA interferase RelE/StbE